MVLFHGHFHRIIFSALLGGLVPCGCDRASRPPAVPRTPSSQLVSDQPGQLETPRALTPLCEYDGRIRHVVFHSADGVVAEAWRAVHDLLVTMPPDVRFTFVCDTPAALNETRGRLRQWKFERNNILSRLIETPVSVWARDRYIAMHPSGDARPPAWLVPQVVENLDGTRRRRERDVPALLNAVMPLCRVAETPLVLEGGNLVASNKQVFIGANVLRANAAREPAEQIRAALADLFALPVVLVEDASGLPPVAHVDMFLTPAADDHVLLGSPALAAEIMAAADAASTEALRQRLFVTTELPGGLDASFSPERVARFDQVAAQLQKLGLEVTRLPYVDSRAGDFIVTYNNALQETREGVRIVYMPIYRIPALDDAARRVYESLGCLVQPIDVSSVCHLLGAVRCLANVVERSSD